MLCKCAIIHMITKKNVRIENLNVIQPDMQKSKQPGALERQ